jgi:alanyl aminopeptidase
VPVCVSYGTGAERGRACTLLEKETGELSLPATACPAWLLANDGNGYYRTSYRGDLMARLLRGTAPLSEAERIGVLGDLAALVEAGELKMGEALAHVPRQLEKPTRHVVGATAGLVMKVKTVVPESLEPSYRRLIVSLYGDTARSLGFLPKPGEDEDTRILRNLVVRLVAGEGRDAALEAEAGRLARLWLDDRKALDPEVVGAVTAVAAGGGDAALFERVLAEAKKAQDQRERRTLIGMLGSFRDPALSRRAHELFLSDTFDVRESGGLLRAGLGETRSREAVWGFITSRWDGITARVPKEMIGFLPWMGAAFCDDGKKAEVEAFFKDRLKDAPGGPRNLQHAVEAISLCSAFRAANLPEVEAVLARY